MTCTLFLCAAALRVSWPLESISNANCPHTLLAESGDVLWATHFHYNQISAQNCFKSQNSRGGSFCFEKPGLKFDYSGNALPTVHPHSVGQEGIRTVSVGDALQRPTKPSRQQHTRIVCRSCLLVRESSVTIKRQSCKSGIPYDWGNH